MRRIRRRKPQWGGAKLLLFTVALGAFIQWLYTEPPKPLSPLAETTHAQSLIPSDKAVGDAESHTPAAVAGNTDKKENSENPGKFETDDMSSYISQAVQEFLPTHKSESLMIMHCLAHRENGHAANNHCGDSGLACGPFQFHPDTWVRARKAMITDGLATVIGDRYDKKESARTTAFSIKESEKSNPRIKITEWGPILRDTQGSDYAACQYPSWLPREEK